MTIPTHELKEMNTLLEAGTNISDISEKYPKYDYWEVYWAVSDYSLMGKKRMITNRLTKLKSSTRKDDREILIEEVTEQLDQIYKLAQKNGAKLVNINQILNK